MVAARTGVRGLTADEVQAIREGLAGGRKPRVQFTESAGQIAGQIGQVVELTDPAVSEEWVVVRFGRDELPFSPADLRVAPRGAALRKAVAEPADPPSEATAVRAAPEFVLDRPASSTASSGKRVQPAVNGKQPADNAHNRVQSADKAPLLTGRVLSAERAKAAPAKDEQPPVKGRQREQTADSAPRRAARPGRAKPPAAMTVTLSYGEGEWTVAATQGAKVLAKPYVIRPAEALRMVSLVDVAGVQEAVEQILAAERAEAEQQAQRLRAELAQVEARLAELGEAG